MKVTIPYKPREFQAKIHQELETKRWALLFIHRRAGKSTMLINQLIKSAMTCDRHQPRFAFVAPYLKQCKSIIWDALKFYTDPIPGRQYNETELRVDLPNGARIRLFGADNAEALLGIYLDGAVLDEYPQMDPSVLTRVLRPALSDRGGWCVLSGTPNGKNHAYDLLLEVQENPDWLTVVMRASETNIIAPEELNDARRLMGEDQYNREYECSFESMEGRRVYNNFNRLMHVSQTSLLPTKPTEILRGWDNTGLTPAICLSYISETGVWCIFKEFCFEDTGIMDAAEVMLVWCNQKLPVGCTYRDIGDPAGKNRDATKQSPADYIKKKGLEYGYTINIQDGIQTPQVRWESVTGRLTKLINGGPAILLDKAGCPMLITGFDGGYCFKEIGNTGVFKTSVDKTNPYTHIHDATQYVATVMFRAEAPKPPVKSVSSIMLSGASRRAWA